MKRNKMKNRILIIAIPLMFFNSILAFAQQDRDSVLINLEKAGWEYEVKAGCNIGGIIPLGMPQEIRSINSYSPRLNGSFEGVVTHWFFKDKKWGASTGLRIEAKGMHASATVKNYSTEIITDGNRVAGYWTGDVNTKYSGTFLTLPFLVDYRFNKRWIINAGIYVSYMLEGNFSGDVSNGYLRQGTPVGEKLEFKDGKTATYDFDSDLRRFEWGPEIGVSWKAFNRFKLNADLAYGFDHIFKKSFKTITFNLYPVYLNVGFGYIF
jgi:hypothetical protein